MPPITVLVVDDYEPFRRFVCSMLEERAEFQVIGQASDGLEAIQKAVELQPDLILMDIGLPKLNGISAAKQIRGLAPHSKLIFVSQESDSEVVQETFRLGASGFVHKPRALGVLSDAVMLFMRAQADSSAVPAWANGVGRNRRCGSRQATRCLSPQRAWRYCACASFLRMSLRTTRPPFITNFTRSNSLRSMSGFPETAMMSANLPFWILPI